MRLVGEHKAKKGLIRVEIEEENGIAKDVKISGDFFIYPEDIVNDLEKALRGGEISKLEEKVEEFFSGRDDVEMPYLSVEDFKMAIRKALVKQK
ncbi:lipoate protein ligase C-terminal domain-containing protein [Pyrococcus horikoshii]|uniref:lipoate--protein ligase n=1 Tax=Pyrococcus horikoshii TaxID=53953 RepID=A0A832T922_PYRHR|nr:lipoate protein ligase C-terminal domain-containing protein [Pyrococcus horikoshii]HII60598.1 lipoate--protein ligase family protein [Pyrococcus horikoshii]